MNLYPSEIYLEARRQWILRQEDQPLNAYIDSKPTGKSTMNIWLVSDIASAGEFCITVPIPCTILRIQDEVDNLHRLFAQKVSTNPPRKRH